MTVSVKGIENVLDKLNALKQKVQSVTPQIVKEVAERGEEYARDTALAVDAYDSGELSSSITHEANGYTGSIISPAQHSRFVEYGTGIVGKRLPGVDTPSEWEHDSHQHGESGWRYHKYGRWYWTMGMMGRPFMWNTWYTLSNELGPISKKIWREW